MPLKLSLEQRFIRFINVIQKSGTGIVEDVLNIAKSSPWSTCGRNFRDILFKYDEYTSVCERDVAKRWYKSVTDEEFMTVGMISELINVRDELVYWGLTPQQQPGSYQGGEMMMKSVFWWRKPEYPEETTDLRQVTGMKG